MNVILLSRSVHLHSGTACQDADAACLDYGR